MGAKALRPALLTSMSIRPAAAIAASTAFRMDPASFTSRRSASKPSAASSATDSS